MASLVRPRWNDHAVATFLLGIGFASLVVASIRNANIWSMSTGMDGALAMGVVAFMFMMLHGTGYRAALTTLLPVFAIQVGAMLLDGRASGFTVVGFQALVFGIVGLFAGKARSPRLRRHVA